MIHADVIEARWNELRSKIKDQWAQIKDHDLDRVAGKREALVHLIEEKYGYTKARAENELELFLKQINFH
jgi:uncharacterized protein YjbJ (UPF0337 family)